MPCACVMGGGMWWGMLFPALVLVALIIGGIVLFRTLSDRSKDDSGSASAMSVLEERFARGEIDDKEFKARRDELLIGKG
jgi:putative membrane protein